MFDPRLAAKVIKVVDISYGGENGFNQAIELAAESLANVKFVQEKKLIQRYFDEISQDTGKYCFGVDDTLKAHELGAVETLIVWENLDITRYVLRNAAGEEIISTGLEMEQAQEPQALLEWFAEKYRDFGANLESITNRSQEGAQFVKGFGDAGWGGGEGKEETTVERRRNEVVVTVRSDVPDEGRCVKFPLESVKIWPFRCAQQEKIANEGYPYASARVAVPLF
ncbi:50S ribosomal protein L30e-like protein [Schizophyllum commune]